MDEFIEHVLKEQDQFRRTVCLAHNSTRYDTMLVARTIEEQGLGKNIHIIALGNKVIQMKLRKKVVFRDTYAYMGVKLASLNKILGLDTNI